MGSEVGPTGVIPHDDRLSNAHQMDHLYVYIKYYVEEHSR